MDQPNATRFCDELKFNRFHWKGEALETVEEELIGAGT